ncbi:SNF2 family N-terminal domain-containing protein [Podospora conica]|nr:SNF2 family N-terminal domain-containing protein [Schizothecium conicum]
MRWKINSFKSQLYNHQVVGVSWMLSREFSPETPHGGILGDAMGLGKTVQILACMAHNRQHPDECPDDHKDKTKATLIIAPASALNQWKNEILIHTHFKPAYIYKRTGSQTVDKSLWMTTDIVLASYEEVVGAFPPKFALDQAGGELDAVDPSLVGDLFKVEFYRVVADEAHKMKNWSSRTSMACYHIKAKHRWAVTGTPILNGLRELDPYLRYLDPDSASDIGKFKARFVTQEDVGAEPKSEIEAIRDAIMLRRTADESFLGSPILNIPDIAECEDVMLERSSEEATILDYHLKGFRNLVKKLIKETLASNEQDDDDDDGKKKWTDLKGFVFSRISHMRQLSAHLFLGDQLIRTFWKKEAFDKVIPKLPQDGSMTNSVLLGQLEKYRRKVEEESLDNNGAISGPQLCGKCSEHPTKPQMTACDHIFCLECIMESSVLYAETAEIPCPECGADVGKLVPVKPGQGTTHYKPSQRTRAKQERKSREYGEDLNGVRLHSNVPNGFLELNDIYYKNKQQGRAGVGESSKLNAALNYIKKWQAEAPDDKIIVFTQWVAFGMILGRRLQEEDIGFLYFFGNMPMETRNRAVSIFSNDKKAKVLIAGFSCTGVALNLTCANRVIHIDLWWNKGLEDQANARVLRIGQEKPTYFVRLLLRDSMDERIIELQEDKDDECAPFMQDERKVSKQAGKLTKRGILNLVGVIRKVNGKPKGVDGTGAKKVRKLRHKVEESEEEEEMSDDDTTEDDDDWIEDDWMEDDNDYEEESDEGSSNDESGTSEED